MDKHEQIREGLKRMAAKVSPPATMLATVKSVSEDEFTCVLEDEVEYNDVRLRPVIDGKESLTLIPKIGTWALAIKIEDSEEWMAVAFGEVDKWILKTTQMEVKIEGDLLKFIKDEFSIKAKVQKFLADTVELANGASEPALKGNATTQVLLNLVALVNQLVVAMNGFAIAQSSAAAAVPILAPLIPGWTALGTASGSLAPGLAQLNVDIPLTKSQKVKLA